VISGSLYSKAIVHGLVQWGYNVGSVVPLGYDMTTLCELAVVGELLSTGSCKGLYLASNKVIWAFSYVFLYRDICLDFVFNDRHNLNVFIIDGVLYLRLTLN
jgi:hypothetical protein